MTKKLSGCQKCRQIGVKLCSKGPKCASERRPKTPGQHGRKFGTKKLSEFGKQQLEKQKVKKMYGVRERQFERFFELASNQKGITGEILLSILERRLDNVIYRLKLANSRPQARQLVSHEHVLVNGKKIKTPSYLIKEGDVISLSDRTVKSAALLEQAIDKRLNMGIRVPEWLELNKKDRKGTCVRLPIRTDITAPIEEHLIVELYSK